LACRICAGAAPRWEAPLHEGAGDERDERIDSTLKVADRWLGRAVEMDFALDVPDRRKAARSTDGDPRKIMLGQKAGERRRWAWACNRLERRAYPGVSTRSGDVAERLKAAVC